MRGHAMHHVGGGDRHISTDPCIYSEPAPRRTGLDWDAIHHRQPPPSPKEPAMTEPPEVEEVDAVTLPIADLPAIVSADTSYFPVPDYIGSMAYVLSASENHENQLVRSVRKIAVQAITTLHDLLTEAGFNSSSDDDPEPEPAQPVDAEWLDPKLVREWCATEGITVNAKGRIPVHIQDLYRKANAA